MRGYDIKQIRMRSFQISGLTAKWGIGGRPSIWDSNLVARWDVRTFPNGALAKIPNTATMADRAPDLGVKGATMEKGTLQFDGVDDEASTGAFLFPERYTIFWDVNWVGSKNKTAGIVHPTDILLYNYVESGNLPCFIRDTRNGSRIPNTSTGLSTNRNIYAPDGSVTRFGGVVGTEMRNSPLSIGFNKESGARAQMGFRQLLIFNKELSQAEVNDVLRVMFPA